jgi:hypothetical protein
MLCCLNGYFIMVRKKAAPVAPATDAPASMPFASIPQGFTTLINTGTARPIARTIRAGCHSGKLPGAVIRASALHTRVREAVQA